MLARAVDLLQVGNGLLVPGVLGLLLQHLAVTDDLIEGRAQIVANVGKGGIVTCIGQPNARF